MSIKRFMVVDTVSEAAMQIKGLLGEMRIQDITVSLNANDALEMLEPKRIEFIILNWDLKGMTAAAFIQRVRESAHGGFIPFLIYTDRMKPDENHLMEDMGISNVMPYPFERAKFMARIKSMAEAENNIDPKLRVVRQAAHLVSLQKFEEALTEIAPVVDDASISGIAYTVKADVEVRLTKFDDAEQSLNKVRELQPDNVKAKQLLARVYSAKGRNSEAVALLQELVDQSPLNLSNLLALTGVFMADDQHAKAKETLDKVSDIDPNNPSARDMRGTIAFKEGDYNLAKEFLQNTPNGDEIVRSLNNIAIGLVGSGQIDRGIAAYKSAIEMLQGKNLIHILHYNLALAYKKSQVWDLALKAMGASLRENPSYEKAQNSFKKLIFEMKKAGISFDEESAKEIRMLFS